MNSFSLLAMSFPNSILFCFFRQNPIFYFAVTSFFQRSLRRRFPRAVSCRNPNGEELVSNKVEDGSTMPFTGKLERMCSFCVRITDAASFSHVLFVCNLLLSPPRTFNSPEPHILLFRRPLGTDPQSGRVDPEMERKAREDYRAQYNRK